MMSRARRSKNQPAHATHGAIWRLALIGAIVAAAAGAGFSSPARADDGLGIRKLDPETGKTLPMPAEQLRPNNIYSHFDARLNRRVWSLYLGDGRFGIAFGPGTTQDARRFNINLPPRSARSAPPLGPEIGRRHGARGHRGLSEALAQRALASDTHHGGDDL